MTGICVINGQRLDASTPHFENVYGFDPDTPPRESQFSGHVNGTVAYEIRPVSRISRRIFPTSKRFINNAR